MNDPAKCLAQLYADSFTEEYRKKLLREMPLDLQAKVKKELSRMTIKPAIENRPGCEPLGYRDL